MSCTSVMRERSGLGGACGLLILASLSPAAAFLRAPGRAPQAAETLLRQSKGSGDKDKSHLATLEVQKGGVTAPLGYFDPLQLSQSRSIRDMKKAREAELKHGRIAMLATVGMLVQEKWTPFFDQDPGPAIHHFRELLDQRPYFWLDLVSLIAVSEVASIVKAWDSPKDSIKSGQLSIAGLKDGHVAGDMDFDPLNLTPKDDNGFLDMRSKELNHGRLAMIAAVGMVAQELVTEKTLLFEEVQYLSHSGGS